MNKGVVPGNNTAVTPTQVPAANLGVPTGPPPGITGSYMTQQGATPIGAVINPAPNWTNNYNNFATQPVKPEPAGMVNGMYQTEDALYDMWMNNYNNYNK
jgi:hypothetical protein